MWGALAGIPTDWIILGFFALFAAFDILRASAKRVVTLALALPVGMAFFLASENAIVLAGIVEQFSTSVMQAILLGIFIVVSYIFIARMGLEHSEEAGQTIQAALGGVALTALVATFWITTPSLDSLWHFGPQVQAIFSETYRFWWFIGSYAVLAFIRNT